MAQVPTGILNQQQLFDGGKVAPTIDLSIGDQNGFLLKPQYWASMSNYIRQPIRAVVMEFPTLMNYMPHSQYHKLALKTLIETQSLKIDGLKSTESYDYDGPLVGNAGEKFESVTKASREVSAPTHSWAEKEGMAITKFWRNLNQYIICDPDLAVPKIINQPAYIKAGSPTILAPDQAFITLYFEPDRTLTRIVNAWLSANMQGRTTGEVIGRKETGGSADTTVTVDIEFTAWTLIGDPVVSLAQDYLDSIKLTDLRPFSMKPFINKIHPDVAATAVGLSRSLTDSVLAATS